MSFPKAIIFDFNGVIADDEPSHLVMFQKVLQEEGLSLSAEEYYREGYLGMDDRGCFETVLVKAGRDTSPAKIGELIRRKALYYDDYIRERIIFFPGVLDFIRKAAARMPLAICSGALRSEIQMILEAGRIRDSFSVIVSAEDVKRGKPDPEGFLLALARINQKQRVPILPAETLVIEDSIAGIAAAQRAGMKALAVTNSYPSEVLASADRVVRSLEALDPASLLN